MIDLKDRMPQFVLTVLVLAGFAGFVTIFMVVDMTEKNSDVIKTILTSMGTACLLSLGYWFGPTKPTS